MSRTRAVNSAVSDLDISRYIKWYWFLFQRIDRACLECRVFIEAVRLHVVNRACDSTTTYMYITLSNLHNEQCVTLNPLIDNREGIYETVLVELLYYSRWKNISSHSKNNLRLGQLILMPLKKSDRKGETRRDGKMCQIHGKFQFSVTCLCRADSDDCCEATDYSPPANVCVAPAPPLY